MVKTNSFADVINRQYVQQFNASIADLMRRRIPWTIRCTACTLMRWECQRCLGTLVDPIPWTEMNNE